MDGLTIATEAGVPERTERPWMQSGHAQDRETRHYACLTNPEAGAPENPDCLYDTWRAFSP